MSLAQILNQNSFLLAAGLGLGTALMVLIARRRRAPRWVWLIWLAGLAAVVGGHFALRTAAPSFDSVEDLQRAIASGRPTLVEFYSDF